MAEALVALDGAAWSTGASDDLGAVWAEAVAAGEGANSRGGGAVDRSVTDAS
jgi:hypothetical protein